MGWAFSFRKSLRAPKSGFSKRSIPDGRQAGGADLLQTASGYSSGRSDANGILAQLSLLRLYVVHLGTDGTCGGLP